MSSNENPTATATDGEWEVVVVEEMDFPRLQKLSLPNVADGNDIPNKRYGTLEFYDKAYDRVLPGNEKLLKVTNRSFYSVLTTDDPIIEELAKDPKFTVFGTDSLIATLMCSTRSVYSWDIIVHRDEENNNVFFDRRPHTEYAEYLTVSETEIEPPQDEENSLNSPKNLAMEALLINRNFSQQVLKMGDEKHAFENPNIPFGDPTWNNAKVGYRYRKWDLGNGVSLVCRCEQDAVTVGQNNEIQYLTVKAFDEWDSRYADVEPKDNSCKLAKWTVQAILTGSDYLKFGYVSRVHDDDATNHVILATQAMIRPRELAGDIGLKMDNAWGILRCIIDLCMKQPDGKYLLMEDPNKAVLRMYKEASSVPSATEDVGDDEDDGGEDNGGEDNGGEDDVGGPDNDEDPE